MNCSIAVSSKDADSSLLLSCLQDPTQSRFKPAYDGTKKSCGGQDVWLFSNSMLCHDVLPVRYRRGQVPEWAEEGKKTEKKKSHELRKLDGFIGWNLFSWSIQRDWYHLGEEPEEDLKKVGLLASKLGQHLVNLRSAPKFLGIWIFDGRL